MIINYVNNQKKYSSEELDPIKSQIQKLLSVFVGEDFIDSTLNDYLEDGYVTLYLVGQNRIKEINEETREISKVTDVLSFPMLDMTEGSIDSEENIDFEFDANGNKIVNFGEIIICPDICHKHALEYGHTLEREMVFLVAHSLLHLFGFDHIEPEDEKKMIFWQRKLMADVGLAFEEEIEFVSHSDELKEKVKSASGKKVVKPVEFPAGSSCEHCGYVAILGRPNVGKSTFLNYISGMKLAIVSHKPQTTRTNIRSIYNAPGAQVIFVDTPGVHRPDSKLSKIMVENSFNSAKHADLVLLMVDGRFPKPASIEKELLKLCRENNKRVILAINKSDDIEKATLLPAIAAYSPMYDFEEIIPISAKEGDNIEILLKSLVDRLPSGPRLFDSEEMTDQTEREIASELIREQVLHYTDQEIPHGVSIEITSFKEKMLDDAKDDYDREMVVINAVIICERKSHKGIILGKDGQMIKRIGTKARQGIERLCGCKVYLELFVKVREDWKNDDSLLKEFGYYVEED